jgi:hypothetical protein
MSISETPAPPEKKKRVHEQFKQTDWLLSCKDTQFYVSKEDMKASGYLACLQEDRQCEHVEIAEVDPETLAQLLLFVRGGKVTLQFPLASGVNALLRLADKLLCTEVIKQLIAILQGEAGTDTLDPPLLLELLITASDRKMTSLHDALIRSLYRRRSRILRASVYAELVRLPPSVLAHLVLAQTHDSYCSCVSCKLVK